MIVDRAVLVIVMVCVAAALGAVVAVSHRTGRGSTRPSPRSEGTASSRFIEVLTVAIWFGLTTGGIHVLVAVVNRFVRDRFLMVGPQMFWMTPVSYALLFAAIALLPAAAAGALPRLRLERHAAAFFAGFGVFSLFLPFPQLHKAAVALVAAGVGIQVGRAMGRRAAWWFVTMRRGIVAFVVAIITVGAGIEAWPVVAERAAMARLPSPRPTAPNVLLIVLDTVRAASLSAYGYERPTTPGLERLARESAVFDFAMSTAPWTLKSHGTMFSGQYPQEIRGDFERPVVFDTPVLAEEFRNRGYVTAGFVGNLVYASRESGLARGFVHYEDYKLSARQLLLHSWPAQTPVARAMLGSRSARDLLKAFTSLELSFDSNDFNRKTYERRPAGDIATAFLDWQAEQKGRPFLAFLNLFDAHFAYRSPREFERRFARDDNPMNGLYDGAIAYMDSVIGSLLDELRRRQVLDNTIVVITSDHGEHFGDHGLILHANSLYTQLLKVPLLIRYPPAVPGGVRVSGAVSLRDLPATIVQLAGLSGAGFPGASLAGQWNAAAGPPAPASLPAAELSDVVRPEPSSPASFGPMRAVFDRQYHYILRGDGAEELFDYRRDPAETNDLSRNPAAAAAAAELKRLLHNGLPRRPPHP